MPILKNEPKTGKLYSVREVASLKLQLMMMISFSWIMQLSDNGFKASAIGFTHRNSIPDPIIAQMI
jgi:hypothetical protein